MLPKHHRVRKPREFRRVLRRGETAQSTHLRVTVLWVGQNQTRFGFVVSKKSVKNKKKGTAGKTAKRNLVKRVLREEARALLKNIIPAADVVILVKEGAASAGPEQLREELRNLLARTGLVKG